KADAEKDRQQRQDELLHELRESSLSQKDIALYLERSRSWFKDQMEALTDAGSFTEADRQHTTKIFQLYCEAKIWEMAVNTRFLSTRYLRRPTPLALCEGTFEDLDLLS